MMRSSECKRFVRNEETGLMEETDADCFCNHCCSESDDDDVDAAKARRMVFVPLYPSYKWYPRGGQVASDEKCPEQLVHEYLVKMNLLPKSLPEFMFDSHMDLLHPALPPRKWDTECLTDYVTLSSMYKAVSSCSLRASTLLLSLCGHGRERDGALRMSDNSVVSLLDIAKCLREAGFKGTAVCVVNVCFAEGTLTDQPVPHGLGDDAPFDWAVIYSSGRESQRVEPHALHVAKMLAALVQEGSAVTYRRLQEAVDRLWDKTRDPLERPSQWRGAPTVQLKANMPDAPFLRRPAADADA